MPRKTSDRPKEPTVVHAVPPGQPKARIYQALCGESIHKSEVADHAGRETTCPTCRELSA